MTYSVAFADEMAPEHILAILKHGMRNHKVILYLNCEQVAIGTVVSFMISLVEISDFDGKREVYQLGEDFDNIEVLA